MRALLPPAPRPVKSSRFIHSRAPPGSSGPRSNGVGNVAKVVRGTSSKRSARTVTAACSRALAACVPSRILDERPAWPGNAKNDSVAAKTDWNPVLRTELAKPYWSQLQAFVRAEREHHRVYPPPDEVFAALHLTPYADTRVVILGQDPYHGPGQAHGLCFSVREGVALPPSLVNIYKELSDDLGIPPPNHGNLEAWARQGVLLLNTTLTVRAGAAASHQGKGWETFTDEVIRAVNAQGPPGRVHPLGQPRPPQEGAARQPSRRHRVRPSVTALGAQRLLRVEAVLADQRGTRTSRTPPDRLAPLTPTVRTSSGRYEPTSIKRLARLRISVARQCRTRRPILVPSVDTDDVSS